MKASYRKRAGLLAASIALVSVYNAPAHADCSEHDSIRNCIVSIAAAAQHYDWQQVEQLTSTARDKLVDCDASSRTFVFDMSYDFIQLYAAINEDAIASLMQWVDTGVFNSHYPQSLIQLADSLKPYDPRGTLTEVLRMKPDLARAINQRILTKQQRGIIYDNMSLELNHIHWPSMLKQAAALCMIFPEYRHDIDLALAGYLDTGELSEVHK